MEAALAGRIVGALLAFRSIVLRLFVHPINPVHSSTHMFF